MSDKTTKHMLDLYEQYSDPTTFLTSFFKTRPKNFHASEEVEIDVVRGDEQVSVVVQDLSVTSRNNSADVYTNKRLIPPIHNEEMPLNAHDLIKRFPGQNPFDNNYFQAKATDRAIRNIARLSNKIKRAIELQASQILQTGKLNLIDANGNPAYALDFKPKTSHFPTVTTSWSDPAATPLADIENLADEIRTDGLGDPDIIIMGKTAYNNFIQNSKVQPLYDNRRFNIGTIQPMLPNGVGGKIVGTISLGHYEFQIWTYNSWYNNISTTGKSNYVIADKVIMLSSTGRLDATYGAIPLFTNPFSGVFPALPPRLSSTNLGLDIFPNAWITPNGRQLMVGAASRPLLIPTAIDTFGCITTTAP